MSAASMGFCANTLSLPNFAQPLLGLTMPPPTKVERCAPERSASPADFDAGVQQPRNRLTGAVETSEAPSLYGKLPSLQNPTSELQSCPRTD